MTPRRRFSKKRLTDRARLMVMGRFIDRLGIKGLLDPTVSTIRGANADHVPGLLLVLL
jgi:hypothetical protein